MISLGTAPMAHPTFRKGDRFLTRRLPRFQAAARAARRQQDKPYTSISLSKVSIDPCEMAYSTGHPEGHCVPMGTTVTVAAEMDFYPQYLPWAFVTPSIVGAREDGKLSIDLPWDRQAARFAAVIGAVIAY